MKEENIKRATSLLEEKEELTKAVKDNAWHGFFRPDPNAHASSIHFELREHYGDNAKHVDLNEWFNEKIYKLMEERIEVITKEIEEL